MEITYDETINKVYDDYTYDEDDFNKGEDFNEENDEDSYVYSLCKIKIGSIVFTKNIGWVKITGIFWDALSREFCFRGLGLLDNCKYDMIRNCDLNGEMVFDNTEELFLLKNTNMDKQLELSIKGHETNDSWAKWDLPDGYEFQDKDGNVINTNIIKLVKKQSKYPKTFIDVLNFWHPDRQIEDDYQRYYKKDLIEKFQNLLYARDAYWKIAGEEMGLGKSWKPDDWEKSDSGYVYCIVNKCNNIGLTCEWLRNNHILSFPTKEMRDAFYENFEKLINDCKEFL